MLSAAQLKELIKEYRERNAIFSPTLSPETIALMREESDFTFSYFQTLAAFFDGVSDLPDLTELTPLIKEFFTERWSAFRKTNIAYTRHPFLPINQLCLKIAEGIAAPDEAVCQILMPTILGLNRKFYSLKSESEDEGHLHLEQFMLNQNQTILIPVQEVFEIAEVNTNTIFPEFQEGLSEVQYILGGRDVLNLEQLAGEASERYVDALRKHHAQRYDNKSIGFAIQSLTKDLKKGSVSDSGSEDFADNEVLAKAIKNFYDLWNNLSEEIKSKVTALRLHSFGDPNLSLQSYFLALFARHPECPLTEKELEQQQTEDIFPCADQISNLLDEFLKQHQALFKMMISEELLTGEAKKDLPILKPLLERAVQALQKRGQTLEGNDDELFGDLSLFTLKVYGCLPEFIEHSAVRMAPHVTSYQHLITLVPYPQLLKELINFIHPRRLGQLSHTMNFHKILPVLPEDIQLVVIDESFNQIFKEIRSANDFKAVSKNLKGIAKQHFEHLYLKKLSESILTVQDLKEVLITLNNDLLIKELCFILKPKFNTLFNNIKDILLILPRLNLTAQGILIGSLSNQLIQWTNPANYSVIMRQLHRDLKSHFATLIVKNLVFGINSLSGCVALLERWKTSEDLQKQILAHFSSFLKCWITDQQLFFSLLNILTPPNRIDFLMQFSHFISNKMIFIDCLKLMPALDRKIFLFAINFELFVTNLSDLQSIASIVAPLEQKIIFAKFNNHKLKCTPEEFNGSTKELFVKTKEVEIKEIINRLRQKLEDYESKSSSFAVFFYNKPLINSRKRLLRNLIEKLNDSIDTSEDIVEILTLAQLKIQDDSITHYASRSTLHELIGKILYDLSNNCLIPTETKIRPQISLINFSSIS